jgi:L-alanine-DL-glutamate epimerase-like enolase superfamily enzyme
MRSVSLRLGARFTDKQTSAVKGLTAGAPPQALENRVMVKLDVWEQAFQLREPFVTSRGAIGEWRTVQVSLTCSDGAVGRGEAYGVAYEGETVASIMAQVQAVRASVEAGADRLALLRLLPTGGARCVLDSALWDLEAKRSGRSAHAIAGLQPPGPLPTSHTLSLQSPAGYEANARRVSGHRWIKVKVNDEDPIACIRAVQRGAPDAALIVDPNQAWSYDQLTQWAPALAPLNVVLLEQPIPVGEEAALDGYRSPVPLCADELIKVAEDLDRAAGRFDFVNIKLDKAGGLTAALCLAEAATAAGFGLMVGCMGGSSLSMAPALIVAQKCAFVDLDGPVYLTGDCDHGLIYRGDQVMPASSRLWG